MNSFRVSNALFNHIIYYMPALAHIGIGLATKKFAVKIPLWSL